MLGILFTALSVTSLAGTVLTAVITAIRPLTKRLFSHQWHYYVWIAVLSVMLAPVRFGLPQHAAEGVHENTYLTEMTGGIADEKIEQSGGEIWIKTSESRGMAETDVTNHSVQDALGYIWLAGVIAAMTVNVIGYIRLVRRVHRDTVITECPELLSYTEKRITVRKGELQSPFMMGIFRPTLVLPDKELSEEQLRNILMHEMTHFCRKDIWYKWLAVLVRCIHWFNPVVYYIVYRINTECEISCDLSVICRLGKDGEQSYINTILSLLSSRRSAVIPLTTGMTGNKKALKGRFMMIKNRKKHSKAAAVISVLTAAVMLGTTVFASGVLADGLINERDKYKGGTGRESDHIFGSDQYDLMIYPEKVISAFFGAFESGDFDTMKAYCTDDFINGFWGDGYVFGMTEASLDAYAVSPLEYAKSSNEFIISVRVNMVPTEKSVYLPDQTSTEFYVILLRQSDGTYLIDEFG